ncbi:4-carboxymuconolactone decarboxylase [Agrobacterium deltaense]|uniref:carboxymuconolactone decarboxylase family protein n=1 Tax=Agrobacterium TaxID=357 RepID=UPI0007459D96|nr:MULTISPECIES: carboxymuconolactone decarboxylase family protein [Agrobacterium]KVK54866.1 4-carboxymuconolactone decarboxylase [Agrobacterium sp. D14]RKF30382.1 4-carboxymuconolactone decarboxylase [Agrobacterium deltaense]
MKAIFPTVLAIAMLAASAAIANPQRLDDRLKRGDEVVRSLNNGQPQSNLERLRQEFPFLADATEGYALGEVWSRPGLDNRTRQLAAVAVMAALGERDLMKVHAGYALNVGATDEELKEMVYLITVPAGFPKAIAASRTLAELFEERRANAASGGQKQ